MIEAEMQLQNALINNYFNNLKFLKIVDNELFIRIENLSNIINENLYEPRYNLEFIKENGEFDIYDSHTEQYLYKKNAKRINNNFINSVKFDNSSCFSSLINSIYDLNLEYENVNLDYESYEELSPIIINNMKEFTEVLKDNTLKDKSYKKFEKFIFIGTLLGRHIVGIDKKIKAKNYFICENNLEIFRLSLFVTNYRDLTIQSKLTFSIMDDENVFIYKYQLFLEDNPDENYCLKYQTTNYNVTEMMHRIISTMYKVNPMSFDYVRVLYNLINLTTKRLNTSNVLNLSKKDRDFNFSENRPVLFVAAGPSLQDNISWLEQNKNRFIIVAIGASYKLLLSHGIKPDVISTVEPSFWELKKHHFTDEDIKKLDNTIILASIFTPLNLTSKLNPENVFYFEINSSFKENSKFYKGYSVGELTVSVLLDLGIKKLYLLGTDLAINPKTGETHFSNYKEIEKIIIKDIHESKSLETGETSFKDELILVKGNFEKQVFTTRIFIMSIFAYEQAIKTFKKEDQEIINLSNHGAYLEGTKINEVKDVDFSIYQIFNKEKLNSILLEKLNSVSERNLSEKEINKVEFEINYFKNLLNDLNNQFSLASSSFEEFKLRMTNFSQEVRNIGYPTLMNYLIEQYAKFSNTYICYCFNDKNIKSELKKLEKIERIWIKQVSNMIEKYINYLDDMIR